jgi:site-specific DNA-methyltransferase (adenine-specific)
MSGNALYFGDNLDVLRRYVQDESVDLIYLDPPFNSNASYNVLFAEQDGSRAASQINALHDTWHWDQSAAHAYEEFTASAPTEASQALQAFRTPPGLQRHARLPIDDGSQVGRTASASTTGGARRA